MCVSVCLSVNSRLTGNNRKELQGLDRLDGGMNSLPGEVPPSGLGAGEGTGGLSNDIGPGGGLLEVCQKVFCWTSFRTSFTKHCGYREEVAQPASAQRLSAWEALSTDPRGVWLPLQTLPWRGLGAETGQVTPQRAPLGMGQKQGGLPGAGHCTSSECRWERSRERIQERKAFLVWKQAKDTREKAVLNQDQESAPSPVPACSPWATFQ